MATEVGAAYVRLLPSMRGFTAEARDGLKRSLETAGREAGARGGDVAGKGFASKFQSRINTMAGVVGRTLGKVAKVGGVAAVAAGGLIGTLGIKRLVGLENANKQLKQLGFNTKEIDGLMTGLLKVVRGTPFALNDAAGAMSAMVSSGTKLNRVQEIMGMMVDAAAFAQKPLSEVQRVFQKIQSQGKVQGDEIMSIAEMGLPAFQILSAGAGKSVDAIRDRIKEGKLTADEFFAAWEKGAKGFGENNIKIEGAAKSAGDTTQGALANMRAAFGRLGEMILGKPFASTKNFFNSVTDLTDRANAKLKPFVDEFWRLSGAAANRLKPVALSFTTNTANMLDNVDWAGMGNAIQEKAKQLGNPMIAGWQQGVETGNWSGFGQSLGSGLGTAFENITTGTIDLGSKIGEAVAGIDWFDVGKKVGKTAVGFLVGFTVGLLQTDIVGIIGKLWENKWGTLLGVMMLIPIGRGVGMIGTFLAKIPFLKVFAPLFTKGGAALEKVGSLFWKLIGKIGGRVLAAFTRAFPRAGAWVENFFGKLPGKANEKMNQLAMKVVLGLRKLSSKIGGFAGRMFDRGLDLMFSMAKGVGRGLVGLGKQAAKIPSKIWAAISGLAASAWTWGWDTIQGFINGIKEKAKELPGVLKDSVVSVVNKFLPSQLHLGSPSKLTKKYGEWTTQGFALGLREGADDVRNEMRDLMSQLKKDVQKGKLPEFLLKQVTKMRKNLIIKSDRRDVVIAQLDNWKNKLQELKDELNDFRKGITDSFTAMGDVTQFEVNNFAELTGYMKNASDQAANWNAVVSKLQALGLKREAIDQLLAAGPEQAMKNAKLILDQGKSGVDQINGFMTSIQNSGNSLAANLGNQFYASGIAAAQGMINGLKAKKSELDEAIKSIATRIVKALKKELKIKSPSQVFFGLGQMVPAGFAGGIDRGAVEVSSSLSRMMTTPQLQSSYANSLGTPQWSLPSNAYAYGGNMRAADNLTKVIISADGLNRKLLEWLREEIRVQGGNVQKVLGANN